MMRPTCLCLAVMALLLCLASCSSARAHEVRPAYIEIAQIQTNHVRIVWKQPTLGDRALRLVPELSNGWLERSASDQYAAGGFLIRQWDIVTSEPTTLNGIEVRVHGLEETVTDVLLRIELLSGRAREVILRPALPSHTITDGSGAGVPMFLAHGIEHILAGVDHLLFVLGLLLIIKDRWKLLKAVSAFTLAHSFTLAAAAFGALRMPPAFVEFVIAASILCLALEALRAQAGGTSLTLRRPWLVAFFFGLFHGMGFAGALTELDFPSEDLLAALLLFNVGVEIGQLAFIASMWLLARLLSKVEIAQPWRVVIPTYVVGIAGAYWSMLRAAEMVGVVG